MTSSLLDSIRPRVLPMLHVAAQEYKVRVPSGFPAVVDSPDAGLLGFEIDPSYALYLVADDGRLYADLYYRSARTDARSSAMREKFAGAPVVDRRPLPLDVTETHLRNLIAELMSRYNAQPGLIYITDS